MTHMPPFLDQSTNHFVEGLYPGDLLGLVEGVIGEIAFEQSLIGFQLPMVLQHASTD